MEEIRELAATTAFQSEGFWRIIGRGKVLAAGRQGGERRGTNGTRVWGGRNGLYDLRREVVDLDGVAEGPPDLEVEGGAEEEVDGNVLSARRWKRNDQHNERKRGREVRATNSSGLVVEGEEVVSERGERWRSQRRGSESFEERDATHSSFGPAPTLKFAPTRGNIETAAPSEVREE